MIAVTPKYQCGVRRAVGVPSLADRAARGLAEECKRHGLTQAQRHFSRLRDVAGRSDAVQVARPNLYIVCERQSPAFPQAWAANPPSRSIICSGAP